MITYRQGTRQVSMETRLCEQNRLGRLPNIELEHSIMQYVTSCRVLHQLFSLLQVTQGILLGVGQIFACETPGPSLLIMGAVLLYSPLLAVHALLGSAAGTLAGGYRSVRWYRLGNYCSLWVIL